MVHAARRGHLAWGWLGVPFLVVLAGAQPAREALLEDLRDRRLIPADSRSYRDEDVEFLARVKKAEAEGAADFLYGKYHRYRPFILNVKAQDGTERFLLSPQGFERYYFLKSQASVKAFEGRGVALKEIFHLTDLKGRPFYDGQGLLTREGEAAYDTLRQGGAAKWKFDWEAIVADEAAAAANLPDPPEVGGLLAVGYLEVSQAEVAWMARTGRCTIPQLEEQHTLRGVKDELRKVMRWFFHKDSFALPWIARYREDSKSQGPYGTPLFGEGGKFCD